MSLNQMRKGRRESEVVVSQEELGSMAREGRVRESVTSNTMNS